MNIPMDEEKNVMRISTKLKPVQEIIDLGLLREKDNLALERESSPK